MTCSMTKSSLQDCLTADGCSEAAAWSLGRAGFRCVLCRTLSVASPKSFYMMFLAARLFLVSLLSFEKIFASPQPLMSYKGLSGVLGFLH